MDEGFVSLPVELVVVGEQDVRDASLDDGIIELAADIASRGLLQPIGVTPAEGGRYQLRWGKRRLLAHLYLHRSVILARVVDGVHGDLLGDALAENLHRLNMTLEEECVAVTRMHDAGRSPEQISALTGKGRQWVLRRLALAGLPDDLKGDTMAGTLAVGSAEALALLTLPHDSCSKVRPSTRAGRRPK